MAVNLDLTLEAVMVSFCEAVSTNLVTLRVLRLLERFEKALIAKAIQKLN